VIRSFNWESWKQSGGWYNLLMSKVEDIADAGITHVWLPPASHSAQAATLHYLYFGTLHMCANL
jgi:alpha-amylase